MTNQISSGAREFSVLVAILRHWILLIIVVAAALFAGTFLLISSIKQQFSSTALLIIQDEGGRSLRQGEVGPDFNDPFMVRGEIAILQSNAVAARVVEEMNLVENPAFNESLAEGGAAAAGADAGTAPATAPEASATEAIATEATAATAVAEAVAAAPDDAAGVAGAEGAESVAGVADTPEARTFQQVVEAYKNNISIFNDGRSPVISITMSAPDAKLASDLANAHVAAYFAVKSQNIASSYQTIKDQVNVALTRSAGELRSTALRIEQLQNESGLVSGEGDGTPGSLLNEELLMTARTLEVERTATDAVRATLRAMEAHTDLNALTAFEPLQTEAMAVLRRREAEARVSILRLEANFGPDDPARRQAELDLDAVQRAMAAEVDQVRAGLRVELQQGEDKIATLQARYDALVEERKTQNLAQAEISVLQAEVESRRGFHETLQRESGVIVFESGFLGADAKLVSSAVAPLGPSFPPTNLFIALAAIVSFCIACGLALLADAIVGRSRSVRELGMLTGLPGLGEVPIGVRDTQAAFQNPKVWQRVREVRARLVKGRSDGGLVVCMIGTTEDPRTATLAVGLAKAVAATGLPALVLDANIGAPSVHRVLRTEPSWKGLVNVLAGNVDLAQAVVNGGQPHFDVLAPGGKGTPHDVEMLSSERLEPVLQRLRSRYRVIVVTAAPVSRFADTLPVLALSDRQILTVPAGRGSAHAIEHAIATLGNAGVELDGFVLLRKGSRFAATARRRSSKKGFGFATPVVTLDAADASR